jgi:hypothetical protein
MLIAWYSFSAKRIRADSRLISTVIPTEAGIQTGLGKNGRIAVDRRPFHDTKPGSDPMCMAQKKGGHLPSLDLRIPNEIRS